eukprot:CAMPEP_0172606288 /NCGR_PEP_ID=MMETSP1068-20121228/26481_1 /TAXON_ID=35684 /ORGANISM="Pseudopedinella elastica, Strain CCMP716" /LENGTH=158 /DNA_ID=CAMNT_0013408957 /DNA_START=186 /DNA_END=662 /DNA_ORIENTATION=-
MGACCSKEQPERDSPTGPAPSYQSSGGRYYGSGTVGGSGGGNPPISAKEAARAAALSRNAEKAKTRTEKDQKMLDARQKNELLGKIHALYSSINKDPPIGLGASSLDALKRHLEYVREQAGRQRGAGSMGVIHEFKAPSSGPPAQGGAQDGSSSMKFV